VDLVFFSSSQASSSCNSCSDGYSTPTVGSTSILDCSVVCPVGTSRLRNEENDCVPCALGYYAAEVGQPVCDPCPRGYFTNTTGSTGCTLCPAGSDNWAPGQSQCVVGLSVISQSTLFSTRKSNVNSGFQDNSVSINDRKTTGIVLTAIGGSIYILVLIGVIIAAVFAIRKNSELQAIRREIEQLKDLQNNRM